MWIKILTYINILIDSFNIKNTNLNLHSYNTFILYKWERVHLGLTLFYT